MNRLFIVFAASLLTILAPSFAWSQSKSLPIHSALFEPADGQCLFFLGQDNDTVASYLSNASLPRPAGVTSYTDTMIDGLWGTRNWDYGAGPIQASRLLGIEPDEAHPTLSQWANRPALALGYYMVGQEVAIVRGDNDTLLIQMAQWIKTLETPVFLRLGYEFNNSDNRYRPGDYRAAFRHIVALFRKQHVKNCAFVWQSDGVATSRQLSDYYPGDDVVDWCAYSQFDFAPLASIGQAMTQFAADHSKPIFVAEASPAVQTPRERSLKKDGMKAWKEWFKPFFAKVHNPLMRIKAVAYIDADWSSQSMWISSPYFGTTNASVEEASSSFHRLWAQEMSADRGWILNSNLRGRLAGW